MTLKDHLRSLNDKQPPDDPKKSSDSEATPPADTAPSAVASKDSPSASPSRQSPTSLKRVPDCLVTVAADGKTGKGFMVDGEGKIANS